MSSFSFNDGQKEKELGVTSHFKGCYTQFLILESCDYSSTAAWAAARRAMGTRNGEHDA